MRIEHIAAEYHLKLPRNYLDFLAAYPNDFTITSEDLELFEPVCDLYLLNDPSRIEECNAEVREQEKDFGDQPWPKSLFVIGYDRCGNYYAIHTEKPHGPVWKWDVAANEFETIADHIDDYAHYVRDLVGLE